MNFEKKSFGSKDGAGNFDDSPTSDDFKPNNWLNAENIRTLTTDAGETGNVETIGSTSLVHNPYLPAGTNIEIGSAVDEANSRILSANWNSNGFHAIYCWDIINDIVYQVLLDAQVVGGLLFDKDHLIHSSRVVNGAWYFTDFLNEPRRINIDSGILLNDPSYITTSAPYASPLNPSVITIIRRQPGLPPNAVKFYQSSPPLVNNFTATQAYRFAFNYQYRQYEISTMSGQSVLINYNASTDLFNRVDINMQFLELIDQDVLRVNLVVLYLNTNLALTIRTWDKNIAADAAAIAAHNAGTQALFYSFYDNQSGIAVDPTYFAKPFDSVPIISETLESAKNRLFMANNLMGYDTPTLTSLSAVAVQNPNTTQANVQWVEIKFDTPPGTYPGFYSAYVLYIQNFAGQLSGNGFYIYQFVYPGYPPLPTTIPFANLIYIGPDIFTAAAYIATNTTTEPLPAGITNIVEIPQGIYPTLTGVPVPTTVTGRRIFKTDASYQVAIEFLDNAGRKTPVLTNNSLLVNTPDRTYTQIPFTDVIKWSLSNANAIGEIPEEAYYFSILITRCLRTRYFLQAQGANASYATKDASGNYLFTQTAYLATNAGCAFDITNLLSFQMGYIFQEGSGDVIKVYVGTGTGAGASDVSTFYLQIIAQVGNWVVTELANMLLPLNSSFEFIFEIYTPYKKQTTEPFYEVAQFFQISQPGTASRQYSVTTGNLNGDIYILSRGTSPTNYFTEAMSPSDKFYQNWNTDGGRDNIVTSLGQVSKISSGVFSNTFIPGAQDNGLSTFDALDTFDIYPECGTVRKLQLTSKVQGQQGGVMLAICEEEICSIYLGEAQLVASAADADLAISTGVVGTINVLKGSFGTINPEGVVEFRGNVFIPDIRNGKIIQYSANGLFPISSYKMTRYWKLFCDQFMSMSQAQIEALGSRPFIFMAVDPHNWELLVTVPKLLNTPPKGYLPDYPNIIYPFDIWDGQAKTLVYKLIANPNHWSGAYSHTPEGMAVVNNNVYGFKNGNMYQHNSITDYTLNIYGVIYKGRMMFVSNQTPNRPKIYNNIAVEGNLKPSLTYFRTEPSLAEFDEYDLVEQASDLLDFDYKVKEGQLYSIIYRNKLVPTETGLSLTGLLTSEKIRALTLKVLIEFTPTTQPLELRYITLGTQISIGHTT